MIAVGLAATVAASLGEVPALRFEDYAEMRYRGQDQTVKVRLREDLSPAALKRAFDETYLERYGHVSPIRIQIVSLRVSAQAPLGPALDLRDIVLVGHSMGGMVGVLYTAAHPQRIRALVVIDSTSLGSP